MGEGCGCWTGKEVTKLPSVSISNFFRLCFEHSFAFLFKFWTTRWWNNPPFSRAFYPSSSVFLMNIPHSDPYSPDRYLHHHHPSCMQHTHSTPPTHLLRLRYFFTRYPLHSIIILQCFDRLIHSAAVCVHWEPTHQESPSPGVGGTDRNTI